jgi:4-hydroxybenzoate polyprenyltransferase
MTPGTLSAGTGSAPLSFWERVGRFLEFIKFSHTVFALPFALVSMLVAARGWPAWPVFGWILVCMVSARTAAMLFNRLVDWDIDVLNPRTAGRSLLASPRSARLVLLCSVAVFATAAGMLNTLCAVLSPLAIVLIFFYSLTKRFTSWSHLFLGLALSAAPMGAWAAVRGELTSLEPWILSFAALLWVFGFDLIYSTLDIDFDRKAGLHSFPSRYGLPATLRLSRALHISSWLALAAFGLKAGLPGWPYWIALSLIALLLVAEHRAAHRGGPAEINKAFFHINAAVSLLLLAGTAFSLWP